MTTTPESNPTAPSEQGPAGLRATPLPHHTPLPHQLIQVVAAALLLPARLIPRNSTGRLVPFRRPAGRRSPEVRQPLVRSVRLLSLVIVVLYGVLVAAGPAPAVQAASANPATWSNVTPSSGSPDARTDPSMAYDPATVQLLLFGGFGGAGSSLLNDTWSWDGKSWTQLSPSTSPPARYVASMAFDPATGQLVLFGGFGSSFLNDTWSWDGKAWSNVTPASGNPSARDRASMAFDPVTGQLLLFGGKDSSQHPLNDTWSWDGKAWSNVTPSSGNPPARFNASMAYDPATGQLLLFGGDNGGSSIFNDTWAYTIPLTITANNQTMPYGGPVPSFTASYSGFVGTDTSAVVSGLTCGATDGNGNPVGSTTPVGTYPITCSGATAPGYTITYVAGTLTITQATPQINWATPADIPYGTALSATQLDATATVNGQSVAGTFVYTPAAGTVLNAGKGQTLSVSFTPTDTTDFTVPSTTSVTINVSPAPLTITALDQHATYGTTTADLTLNSNTITYDGFINGETAASLTTPAQLQTTATKASPVGTYPITVDSAADPNYSITFVPGTLHVDPAPLTITPANLTMTYKGPVPAYTWTANFINGDTSASLTTQPTCVATDGSGNPVSSSTPAGVYPITCSGAVDPNYTISYTTGTLTVLYGTGGYLQPVNDTAHGETCGSPCPMSVFKAGQTIPFKFQIKDAAGNVVGPDENPVTFTATYAGTTAQPVDESTLTGTPTTGTTFTWTGTMYQYNWKSPSQPGSLYRITATFANGQTIQVTIGLR